MPHKLILLLLVLIMVQSPLTFASNGQQDYMQSGSTGEKTKAQIIQKWREYSPKYKGNPVPPRYEGKPYITPPHYDGAPYTLGKLHPAFIEDGVNVARFARFLAHVPENLVNTDELNTNAQYGSVLLAAINDTKHQPEKPGDMDEDFYKKAYEATSANSLTCCGYFSPKDSAFALIKEIDEFWFANIGTVGHRYNLLHPNLKGVGFGYANTYSVITHFWDGSEIHDYDFVAWPGSGYFPSNFFTYHQFGTPAYAPWSVFLNSTTYETPLNINNVKITLKNITTNKVWTFDKTDHVEYFSPGQKYMNVQGDRIVFMPDGIESYRSGDVFEVTITGVKKQDLSSAEIKYIVKLFDINETPISIKVNGEEKQFDQDPVLINQRTLVPLRGIFESLGAEVTWNESMRQVIAAKDEVTVILTIGSKSATINGETKEMDVPPQIKNGRTLVPVRFISESLGAKVDWDGSTSTVIINNN